MEKWNVEQQQQNKKKLYWFARLSLFPFLFSCQSTRLTSYDAGAEKNVGNSAEKILALDINRLVSIFINILPIHRAHEGVRHQRRAWTRKMWKEEKHPAIRNEVSILWWRKIFVHAKTNQWANSTIYTESTKSTSGAHIRKHYTCVLYKLCAMRAHYSSPFYILLHSFVEARKL